MLKRSGKNASEVSIIVELLSFKTGMKKFSVEELNEVLSDS